MLLLKTTYSSSTVLLQALVHCLVWFGLVCLAALGLRCCAQAFSSCGEQGLLFIASRLLIAVASLVAEHGL